MDNITTNNKIDLCVLSDLHKDVYGFRPKGDAFLRMSEDKIAAEFERLATENESQMRREEQRQSLNAFLFVEDIKNVMKTCGCDERRAIQIVAQGVEPDCDLDNVGRFEIDHVGWVYGLNSHLTFEIAKDFEQRGDFHE